MSNTVRIVLTFLIGALIFVGLPLVGWGVMDIPAFFDHPARVVYVLLVLLLNAFAAIKIPSVGKKYGEVKKTVRRQHIAVVLLQVFSLLILLIGPYCDRRNIAVLDESNIVRILGIILYAIGFLVMLWAQYYLGKQFSLEVTIQEGHRLVTDGLFRYLRHPRYLGIIIFVTGISLSFRSWLAMLFAGAITLVLLWRIHDEEMLMHQEFGAAWQDYRQRSWRLIPFLF